MRYVLTALTFFISAALFSQTLPSIVVDGNQEFCGETPMPIVTNVSITNANGTNAILDVVYVQISEGYASGQDLLLLTGTHPSIAASWSAALGRLSLNGPATYSEYKTAIEAVRYQTTQSNFTEDKFFSINLGDANYLPSTGHYYFYVPSMSITWIDARAEAETLDYFGLQGYLATLTSIEEAQLAGEQSSGTGWFGASDSGVEGLWKWVTGPETGLEFYDQNTNQPINNEFSFWNTGEPNDFTGEDYAHITDPNEGVFGSWNDLSNTGDLDINNPYHPQGYIVEFGGMPGDPEINVSGSSVIVTPKVEFDDYNICDSGPIDIDVSSNTNTVLWFETPSSTAVLNSGLTYNTTLNTTTTFWLLPLFSGCNGGTRIPMTITVNALPEANDLELFQCNDTPDDDGISVFNLNAYLEDINTESTATIDIDFFLDQGFTMSINAETYTNTSNGQVVYARVTNTSTSCINVSEITLQVRTSALNTASISTCEDNNEDGLASFMLTEADNEILGGLPANYSVAYYETYENALLQQSPLPSTYTNTVPYNQVLYARINEDASCYAINQVFLEVIGLLEIETEATRYYCLNSFPETITLSGGVQGDDFNNYYYDWSTGENTSEIDVNVPGIYTVLVTATNGCSKSRNVTVLPSNIATVESIQIENTTNNNTITVLVSGEGIYEYALDDVNGLYQTSPIFYNVL
jgi:hypothetical protein